MSKEQHTEQESTQIDARVYELGFHFVPTLSEDDAAVQFSHLKSLVEKRNGKFISEESPKLLDLAYEIAKTVKAEKKRYTSAYFGWVKFDLSPEEVAGLEKDIKLFEPVLRYILITTARENTLANIVPKEGKEGATKKTTKGTETQEAGAAVIDETQVDKSIDQLVQA